MNKNTLKLIIISQPCPTEDSPVIPHSNNDISKATITVSLLVNVDPMYGYNGPMKG